jgi:hypothetical protein
MACHSRRHEPSSTLLLGTSNSAVPSHKLSIEEQQLPSRVNFMFWLCSRSQKNKIIVKITSNIPAHIINTIFSERETFSVATKKKWNVGLPLLTAMFLDYHCHVTVPIIDHYNRYVTEQSVYAKRIHVWHTSLLQLTASCRNQIHLLTKNLFWLIADSAVNGSRKLHDFHTR